jgi:CubicO group peptidase (beta-lactamase class C family)
VSAALSIFLIACNHQPKLAVRGAEADALRALSVHADRLAREDRFSGAALVAKGGRVLFSRAYGLADRKRGIPNTLRTRFRIGSMNKMFTAVAILQLVGAGKVKLTAPLGTYLPDYPPRGRTSLSPIGKPGDWTSSACISSIGAAFAMPTPPPPMKP